MNERIRELALVAARLADDELAHLERVHNRLYSFTEGREILMGKFAELIVKECVEVAHCNFHVDGLALGNIMKEHFGVEE